MFFFLVTTDGAVDLTGTLIEISEFDTDNIESSLSFALHKSKTIFNDEYKVSPQIKRENEKLTIVSGNSTANNGVIYFPVPEISPYLLPCIHRFR